MPKIAQACMAALALAASSAPHGAPAPARPHARPSSYAPQEHSSNHVYGAPIEAPLVGRARVVPQQTGSTSHTVLATTHGANDHRGTPPRRAPRAKSKPGHAAVQDF